MTDSITSKNKASLVILFSIGLVPVLVAYVVYVFFPHLLPATTTNQGQLIVPPIENTAIGLEKEDRKWLLLLPVDSSCGAECEQRLYLARQINLALGKESERVKRVLIVSANTSADLTERLMQQYHDMRLLPLDGEMLANQLSSVVARDQLSTTIFVMDPNGNIMMYYSLDRAGKGMLRDLKHLLKVSNIG
ncbi:MAG: hypothetical protein KUG79_13050 [Pseudomonadales bacterium]|nr:hypothetical protein [Pseudomonadales bacterium]